MMNFLKTDYDHLPEGGGYDALPTGNYEVVIKDINEKEAATGNAGIAFQLEVRHGIGNEAGLVNANGKFAGRVFFTTVWNSERNPEYRFTTLNAIAVAAGASNKRIYETFEDFKKELINKPVRVAVTHDVSTFQGEDRVQETVAPWDWEPTQIVLENV
ncbi:hypothetical protein NT95_01290 [Oenococcus kitaharae]|nr:hypothetical protein NT95_01290 [Oenococcus kitaharae]OEY85018.1 hypothetical protein NT96_02860 [Oenococcus kitaharae]OEY85809.1 hypothetical protein NV75_03165 [Oenococcus kitaharae]